MSDDYRAKLRSISFARHRGTSRTVPVVADDGPRRGTEVGAKTEHWDGRTDAVARVETIRMRRTDVEG